MTAGLLSGLTAFLRRPLAIALLAGAVIVGIGSATLVSTFGDVPPATPLIRWAYLVAYDPASEASVREHVAQLDYVSPFWFAIDGRGEITRNNHDPEMVEFLRSKGVRIVPTVKNAESGDNFHPLIASPEARSAAVETVSSLIEQYGYDGIHIDFEGLLAEDRDNLTAFQTALWERLKPSGKMVTQTVNAKTRDRRDGFAGAHDYAALAQVNDLILLQAYGLRVSGSEPGAGAPAGWVDDVLEFAVTQIPREKLLLGVPWYGFDWNTGAGRPGSSVRYGDVLDLAERFQAAIRYEDELETPYLEYVEAGERHEVWFENRRSFEAKLALARKHGVAGIGGWRLGHEDEALWESWPEAPPVQVPPENVSPPPAGVVYFERGYPEAGEEGCTWWISRWSDASFSRLPLSCPDGAAPLRDGKAVAADRRYPEIGGEGCTWHVQLWSDGVYTRAPQSCPTGAHAIKPVPPSVEAPTQQQDGIAWLRGYPEIGGEGCTWYVASWSDGAYTKTPWICPDGITPFRRDRPVAAARGYPELGGEGCTWYVTRWSDGVFTKVPFRCPVGAGPVKPS